MEATGALLVLAVPVALAGAAAMGLANVAQSRATQHVPVSGFLDPRLIWHLLRDSGWLIGTGATLAGLVLQVVALGFGPLLLVQPLLVTALPFTTVFAAWARHRRIDRVIVIGVGLCVAGLCAFLLTARPAQASDRLVGSSRVLPLAITFAVVVACCLTLAYRTHRAVRVVALALATGVVYGVTAGLMKIISGQFRIGFGVPFTSWALYVGCVIGPIGFLLSQSTFQQGKMATPAVAVITTVDPLVGVGIGVSWFGETVHTSPGALVGEMIAALAIISGVALLAHRGEALKRSATQAARGAQRRSPS
ncbi:MAG: DMT family transporter [Sciscionella sp.]